MTYKNSSWLISRQIWIKLMVHWVTSITALLACFTKFSLKELTQSQSFIKLYTLDVCVQWSVQQKQRRWFMESSFRLWLIQSNYICYNIMFQYFQFKTVIIRPYSKVLFLSSLIVFLLMFRVDLWGSLPQLTGQCSSSTVQIKTQELSREYEQMLKDLREEKDRELQNIRVNK